jgi:hypothetical protein
MQSRYLTAWPVQRTIQATGTPRFADTIPTGDATSRSLRLVPLFNQRYYGRHRGNEHFMDFGSRTIAR